MDTANDTDAGYSMSSESAGISPYTSPNINNEASKIAYWHFIQTILCKSLVYPLSNLPTPQLYVCCVGTSYKERQ